MITKFDKNGIAEHFKREFAARLEKEDFEGALDYLIKYSDEKHNPDFHLACGMLYMLMTQDSDDVELCYMAYREFMLHIVRAPDCERAYLYLLVIEFLRRDLPDLLHYERWLDDAGIDFKKQVALIAENGFVFGSDMLPAFDGIIGEGDFGEIDPNYEKAKRREEKLDAAAQAEKIAPDKIIKFGGSGDFDGAPPAKVKTEKEQVGFFEGLRKYVEKSLGEFDGDGGEGGEIKIKLEDGEMSVSQKRFDIAELLKSCLSGEQPDTDIAIHLAESFYDMHDLDAALRVLERVDRSDEKYYFVLCMRALILLDADRLDEAERALKEASDMTPGGALAGTLTCRLYEKQGRVERIPAVLKSIDNADFLNGEHVYKAFRFALEYCTEDDALDLIEGYIDEYGILDMRLIYAQIMYNRGDREFAIDELYTLSRIFYDDINVQYFYEIARSGVDRMPVSEEAPQDILAAVAESFMQGVRRGLPDGMLDDSDFELSLEFFMSLEFDNGRAMLLKMFDTVHTLARDVRYEEKMRDELVSPYVEPLVKGVILSELLAAKPDREYLAEVLYRPITGAIVGKQLKGMRRGYYGAYATAVMLGLESTEELNRIACELEAKAESGKIDDGAYAYYVIKRAFAAAKLDLDDRVPFTLGFKTKQAAQSAYRAAEKIAEDK